MTPFVPGAPDHHFVNALRFWPTMSSTSGMRASGQGPVAPSGPEAMVTFCMTSANTRTFAAGMVAPFGPPSGPDHENELSFSADVALLPARATTRKPPYPFRPAQKAGRVGRRRAAPRGDLG